MIAGYYDATTPANVSWQASPLQAIGNADTTHQIEVAHQLQLAHVAQQGKISEPRKHHAFALCKSIGKVHLSRWWWQMPPSEYVH